MKTIIGYHFTGSKLTNGDPIPPVGVWLTHTGEVVPCRAGLHASEHPFDALNFAPGNLLHHVELRGELVSHGDPPDKWVGRERKILKTIDAEKLLRRFACDQALSVIHLWDAPRVVCDYLTNPMEKTRIAAWAACAAGAAGDAAAACAAGDAGDAVRHSFLKRVKKEFGGK